MERSQLQLQACHHVLSKLSALAAPFNPSHPKDDDGNYAPQDELAHAMTSPEHAHMMRVRTTLGHQAGLLASHIGPAKYARRVAEDTRPRFYGVATRSPYPVDLYGCPVGVMMPARYRDWIAGRWGYGER